MAASGQRPIETVNVSLRAGSTTRDTVIALESPAVSIDETFLIPLSATLSGTDLVVTVTVEDDRDTETDPRSLTIPIEDASLPTVYIQRPVRPTQTISDESAPSSR